MHEQRDGYDSEQEKEVGAGRAWAALPESLSRGPLGLRWPLGPAAAGLGAPS